MNDEKNCYGWPDLVEFAKLDCDRIKTRLNDGIDRKPTIGGDFFIYSKKIHTSVTCEVFKEKYRECEFDLKMRVEKLKDGGKDQIHCTKVESIANESNLDGNTIQFVVHLNKI